MTKREIQAAEYAAEIVEEFFPQINLTEQEVIRRRCLEAANLEIQRLRQEVATLKEKSATHN